MIYLIVKKRIASSIIVKATNEKKSFNVTAVKRSAIIVRKNASKFLDYSFQLAN